MKTRIIDFALVFLFITTGLLKAQEYKIPVENAKDGILSLSDFSGDLNIEGYAGNEIVFYSSDMDRQVTERAKGLKPIYPGGTDNTGIGLSVTKNGNRIEVVCLMPFTKKEEYTIKVPENISIKVNNECQYSCDISISKMKNEVEVQACHDINLYNVSGPLVLSTISGDINITSSSISYDKPLSINTISGDIDITLSAKIAVDIEMGTVSGTMYSDFDFSESSKEMKRVGGSQLTYKLNGGGVKFRFNTVSGNIYLRKGA